MTHGLKKFGSLRIIQVPDRGRYAVFDSRRIRPASKRLQVMISFDRQGVTTDQSFFDVGSDMAGIRQHAEPAARAGEYEVARFAGIVGHRERLHGYPAEL
jgi:hypothetical protein